METQRTERKCIEVQFPVPWGHVAGKAWGVDRGQRALLVHGTLDNAASFDRLIQHLPEDYYFVSIDLPGHGLSSHFPAGIPLDFFHYMYTISLVLDELKWKVCVYIGHSVGASLGMFYSIIYPDRFEKLICLELGGRISLTAEQICYHIRDIYEFAKIQPNDKFSHLYTREEVLYSLRYRRLSSLTLDAAKALFSRAVIQVGDKYRYTRDPRMTKPLIPLMGPTLTAEIVYMISCPMLIILSDCGIIDKPFPVDILVMIKLLRARKDIEIVYVTGNHDVHNNNPERVALHVCDHLRKIPNSRL